MSVRPRGFPATLLEAYRPLRLIGRGGMGAVYAARDLALGRTVAVKTQAPLEDPTLRARFQREVTTLARVQHPNVLRIYTHGIAERVPYIVTELLEGHPGDRLPDSVDPVEVMLPIAEALHHIHQQGILHRDLKPANLFVTHDGRPVLLDFGLILDTNRTRLTEEGLLVGTFRYMAPEVLTATPPSRASDWYSWTATLYYLLAGQPPFDQKEILARCEDREVPLRLPPRVRPGGAVAEVLRDGLDLDPDRRPADPRVLRERLQDASRPWRQRAGEASARMGRVGQTPGSGRALAAGPAAAPGPQPGGDAGRPAPRPALAATPDPRRGGDPGRPGDRQPATPRRARSRTPTAMLQRPALEDAPRLRSGRLRSLVAVLAWMVAAGVVGFLLDPGAAPALPAPEVPPGAAPAPPSPDPRWPAARFDLAEAELEELRTSWILPSGEIQTSPEGPPVPQAAPLLDPDPLQFGRVLQSLAVTSELLAEVRRLDFPRRATPQARQRLLDLDQRFSELDLARPFQAYLVEEAGPEHLTPKGRELLDAWDPSPPARGWTAAAVRAREAASRSWNRREAEVTAAAETGEVARDLPRALLPLAGLGFTGVQHVIETSWSVPRKRLLAATWVRESIEQTHRYLVASLRAIHAETDDPDHLAYSFAMAFPEIRDAMYSHLTSLDDAALLGAPATRPRDHALLAEALQAAERSLSYAQLEGRRRRMRVRRHQALERAAELDLRAPRPGSARRLRLRTLEARIPLLVHEQRLPEVAQLLEKHSEDFPWRRQSKGTAHALAAYFEACADHPTHPPPASAWRHRVRRWMGPQLGKSRPSKEYLRLEYQLDRLRNRFGEAPAVRGPRAQGPR